MMTSGFGLLSLRKSLVLAALLSLGFFGGGCRTAGKQSAAATVIVRGNTAGQISDLAAEVFKSDGYQVTRFGLDRLVCEKHGSTLNNLAYGGWTGDSGIWIRMKLSLVPAGEAAYALDCRVFRVSDRAGLTEEETPIGPTRSCRKLLDEIAARLGAEPLNAKQ